MNCAEFEAMAADFESDTMRTAEAKEHLRSCVRCVELFQVQQELREGLRVLARQTESVQTPARVEITLLKKVRAKRPLLRWSGQIRVWGWTAAVAVMLVAFWLSSHQWTRGHRSLPSEAPTAVAPDSENPLIAQMPMRNPETSVRPARTGSPPKHVGKPVSRRTEVAERSRHLGRFISLPYNMQGAGDNSFVMRMRMTHASLGALGLLVNEEQASELVQVDVIVGADGQPQAVRFLR